MRARHLALWFWSTGFIFWFGEGWQGASLAQATEKEETVAADPCQAISYRNLGEKEAQKGTRGSESSSGPSLVESLRAAFTHSQTIRDDLVLSDVSSSEPSEDRILQGVPVTLEQGMDSSNETQIPQQKQLSQEEGERSPSWSTGRSMEGISGKGPMDTIRTVQRSRSGNVAAQSSTWTAEGGSVLRRRSQKAGSPSRAERYECGSTDGADRAVGDIGGEREERAQCSSIVSWTSQQADQAQNADRHPGQKDREPGHRVDSVCPAHSGKDIPACGVVPAVSRRTVRELQREVGRAQSFEAGVEPSLQNLVGSAHRGTGHGGRDQPGAPNWRRSRLPSPHREQ